MDAHSQCRIASISSVILTMLVTSEPLCQGLIANLSILSQIRSQLITELTTKFLRFLRMQSGIVAEDTAADIKQTAHATLAICVCATTAITLPALTFFLMLCCQVALQNRARAWRINPAIFTVMVVQ